MQGEKIRVLLIEDNVDYATLIKEILADCADKFMVEWMSTYDKGLLALKEGGFDVCLLDYKLGAGDGLELLRDASETGIQTPVVFLTGMGDDDLDRQALDSGAADYIAKDEVTPSLLRRIIRHSIERARVTDALCSSEEKFHAVFENAAIGIALVDMDARLLDVNPCFTDIFQISGEGLSGRTLGSLAHEDDREKLKAVVDGFMGRRLQCCHLESRYVSSGGEVIWARLLLSPLELNKDSGVVAAAMMLDITAARRAEEALRQAALVFGHTIDGVIVTGRDGVIRSVNAAFTRITGYEPHEVIGRKPNVLKSNHHPPEFYASMWDDLVGKGEWDGEVWNRKKSGETYIESMSVRAVRNDQGKISQFVAVFRDVTKEQTHQQELRYHAYHDSLTGLPNRALFQERLGQAILRARRARRKLALLFIDLDGFKAVNDRYGHYAGDLLLKGVAARIVMSLREEDTVARLGGDEFTVVLENVGGEGDVGTATNRIIGSMGETFNLHGKPILVTLSVGVAIHEDFGEDSAALIKRADGAMYRAKKLGDNNVIYDGAAD